MDKKQRKPLTPEQREAKNKKDRLRRIARRAGKKPALPAATKPAPKPAAKPPVKPPVKIAAAPAKPKSKRGRPHGKPPLRKLSEASGKFQRPAKIKQNGISRPTPVDLKTGKPRKTFRVWQIADEISAKAKRMATRQEVLAVTKKERIDYSTFSNSFYSWRKFNGVRLRLRKDGELSKPMGPGHGPNAKKAKGKPAKKAAKSAVKPAIKPPVKKPAKPQTKPVAAKVVESVPVAVIPVPVAMESAPVATPAPAPVAPVESAPAKPPVPVKPPLPSVFTPPPIG